MKVAVLKKIEKIEIEERLVPVPGPGEVLIKVEAVGVCGSDVHYYRHGRIGSQIVNKPLVLGHEAAGKIVVTGKGVGGIKAGTRVALEPGVPCRVCEFCRKGEYNVCLKMRYFGCPSVDGAYREYLTHPADFVFPLPANLSYEEGAMIEPLSVGLHAVELGGIRPGDTVAVIGAGSIGLCALQAARLAGAGVIFISDKLAPRLKLAKKFGAGVTVDASLENLVEVVKKATGGRGVDVAIEAVGSDETFQQTLDAARPGATVVFIGIKAEGKITLDIDPARKKGLTIKNVRRFRHWYSRAIQLTGRGKTDVKSLVTHRFPMKRILDAFRLVENYSDGVVKAVVYPGK